MNENHTKDVTFYFLSRTIKGCILNSKIRRHNKSRVHQELCSLLYLIKDEDITSWFESYVIDHGFFHALSIPQKQLAYEKIEEWLYYHHPRFQKKSLQGILLLLEYPQTIDEGLAILYRTDRQLRSILRNVVPEPIANAAKKFSEFGDKKMDNPSQNDLIPKGHAIECRINAERLPAFSPSPGNIKEFHSPGGIGIRMDSAIYNGFMVPPHYDSLIGKLIVHADSRSMALSRLSRALDELIIDGVDTTVDLFKRILDEEDFICGDYNIHWLENWLADQVQ